MQIQDDDGDEWRFQRFLVSGNESFAAQVLFSGSCVGEGAREKELVLPHPILQSHVRVQNMEGKGFLFFTLCGDLKSSLSTFLHWLFGLRRIAADCKEFCSFDSQIGCFEVITANVFKQYANWNLNDWIAENNLVAPFCLGFSSDYRARYWQWD